MCDFYLDCNDFVCFCVLLFFFFLFTCSSQLSEYNCFENMGRSPHPKKTMGKTSVSPLSSKVFNPIRTFFILVGTVSSIVCGYYTTKSLLRSWFPFKDSEQPGESVASWPTTQLSKYRTNHRFNIKTPPDTTVPKWGSFRPGLYFGMKETSFKALPPKVTGIMWSNYELMQRERVRHHAAQGELDSFSWLRHDGRNFGSQSFTDKTAGVQISGIFIAPNTNNNNSEVAATMYQRFTVVPIAKKESFFYFYVGVDCESSSCNMKSNDLAFRITKKEPSECASCVQSLEISGYNLLSGTFTIEVNLYSEEDNQDNQVSEKKVKSQKKSPVMTYWAPMAKGAAEIASFIKVYTCLFRFCARGRGRGTGRFVFRG